MVLSSPLQDKLDDNAKTAQTTAKQHAGCRSEERGYADGFDILPRNDVPKEVGRELAGGKTKRSAQDHAR
jgi:hypothetical protein